MFQNPHVLREIINGESPISTKSRRKSKSFHEMYKLLRNETTLRKYYFLEKGFHIYLFNNYDCIRGPLSENVLQYFLSTLLLISYKLLLNLPIFF